MKRQKVLSFLKKEGWAGYSLLITRKVEGLQFSYIAPCLLLLIRQYQTRRDAMYFCLVICRENMSFLDVYMPQQYMKPVLSHSFFQIWQHFLPHTYFQEVTDIDIDRTLICLPPTLLSPRKVPKFCKDLDLYDASRVLHPTDKDYMFFSIPHQVFSRIDYFLSSRTVLGRILNCTIDRPSFSLTNPLSV